MLASFYNRAKIFSAPVKRLYLSRCYCANKPVETKPPQGANYSEIHRRLHPPNNFERKMLVWTGRYKTLEEIPVTVPVETIEKARSKMRIKVANWMMFATIIGCAIMIITGKRAAERGESLAKQNIEWHKQYNEKK